MSIHLTRRERATILAALRYWQQDIDANADEAPISPEHFSSDTLPLSVLEIDTLCERLTKAGRDAEPSGEGSVVPCSARPRT